MEIKNINKLLRPNLEQLKSLKLKEGVNKITFVISTNLQGLHRINAKLYL